MENTIFVHTLQQAKNGDTSAHEQIILKFQPMIRKYAYKCHAMEYEDAQQELTLALLIAIQSIKYIQNEGACICFIQNALKNHFKYLCRMSIRHSEYEQSSESETFASLPAYSDFGFIELNLSLQEYMRSLSSTRQKILNFILSEKYSTSEIADKLHLSVQYINRVKKEFLSERRKFT